MKRLALTLSVFLIAISFAFAQTKMIAHRSHSGDDASLTFMTEDNFGLPSTREVFVIDTATQEKKWISVPSWSVDTNRIKKYGLRMLPYDSAYPIPDYRFIQDVESQISGLKFNGSLFNADTATNR